MKRLIEILATGVTNDAGSIVASGTVTFYLAGTTTLQTVYEDFALTDPHPNPATLDAAGRLIAYSDKRLKLVIASSSGSHVRTIDNVGTADSDLAAASASTLAGDGLVAAGDGTLAVNVDNSTIELSSDAIRVKDSGISTGKINNLAVTTAKIDASAVTTAKINDLAVTTAKINDSAVTAAKIATGVITQVKMGSLGQQVSASSGSYSTTSTSYGDVTNLTVTITGTGRPIALNLISDPGSAGGYSASTSGGQARLQLKVLRDSSAVAEEMFEQSAGWTAPASLFWIDHNASAATYTYKVQARVSALTSSGSVTNVRLVAWEL